MKGTTFAAQGVLCAGMALLLSGCLVEMLMSTAVTADMAAQNAGEVTGTMTEAQEDTDMVRIQEAVDLYAAEKGAFPRDLSALVPSHIEAVPLRPDGKPYGYNPLEGEVYESGEGPSPADYFMMEKIEMAIQGFGTQSGYYPPTLDALYPTYLPLPPRTQSGKPFHYDNQTGLVTHPDEGKQYGTESSNTDGAAGTAENVKPVNAVGSLGKGDLKDSNSLNKALDRIGY
jgi:hypothetical protein